MMKTRDHTASADIRRARILLTQLRRRQLDEARHGRIAQSEQYARRAERVRRFIANQPLDTSIL